MLNLFKGNVLRLAKNKLYLGGCVIAFAVTLFLMTARPIEVMKNWEPSKCLILISAAVVLFFSFFPARFVGAEYSDGVIRNKIVAGHSQKEIFYSDYAAMLAADYFMILIAVIAGLAGGVRFDSQISTFLPVFMLYNAVHIAFMMAVSFRIRKTVLSVISGMSIFYLLTNTVLIGNLLVSRTEGAVLTVCRVLYNTNIFGQVFIHMDFMGPEADPGMPVRVLIACVLTAAGLIIGTAGLKKRDIK